MHLGKIYSVYFEDLNKEYHVSGRSDNNIVIKVKGSDELLGEFRDVKITEIGRTILSGEVVG
jgi:tRNA-2-methylthio-N6-dimethylallyladenosine synthase